MWQAVGVGVGVALAMGLAGGRGRNWAVRVACALAFVLAFGGLLLGALFAGKASPAWGTAGGLLFGFGGVALGAGLVRGVARVRAKSGALLGAGVVVVAFIAGAFWFGGVPWSGVGAFAGSGLGAGEVQPADAGAGAGVGVAGCRCADGEFCTGPRGGRYCIRPDGQKKYQP